VAAGDQGLSVIVLTRGKMIEVVPLAPSGSLVVGRGGRNGLKVADPTVSREHARISWDHRRAPALLTVEDLGSANGTRVNDVAVIPGPPIDFSAGAPIAVGATILIVIQGSARLSLTQLAPVRDLAESQKVTVIRGKTVADEIE
jgi:SARP family transcriptional regulator, regulator of embCAB operon